MIDRLKCEWARSRGVPFRLTDKERAWCCFGGALMALAALALLAT